MNPVPRKLDQQSQDLVEAWLKHNTPTQCDTYARTDPEEVAYKNAWGKKKQGKS